MVHKTTGMLAVLLVACGVLCGGLAAAEGKYDKAAVDQAFAELPKYDWGQSREALSTLDDAIVATHGDAAARKYLEAKLIDVLKGQATRAAKDFACRKLSMIGTAQAVPALAALLPDKDLSHMGRYALERMPAGEAGAAILAAVPKVSGQLKVGVINSLGARADAKATTALIGLLKDSDPQVAGAAAAALGKIGTVEAAQAVDAFRKTAPEALKGVAVDAALDAAQRLLKAGKLDEAGKIYEELDKPDQPERVRKAAFQGLVAVKPGEATPRLMKALAGSDAGLRGLAVRLIEETPGTEATKAFAADLAKLPPEGQVALLGALGARKDPAARPAVLEAAKSSDEAVQAAALRALGTTGTAQDAAMLAQAATSDKKDIADAARASLVLLSGKDVNSVLIAALGDAKVRAVLIDALAARGDKQAAEPILKYAADSDGAVRQAAIAAEGALGDAAQAPALVEIVKTTKDDKDREAAQQALAAICTREKEKCADAVIAGLTGASPEAQAVLLDVLSRVGGGKALAAVLAGTKSPNETVQDAAIRTLANWPDPAATDPLMDLAESAKSKTHQVLALRGFVRLIRIAKTSDAEKVKDLQKAMELAKGTGEKRLVLGALGTVATIESLKLIAPCVDDKALAEEAGAGAVSVAGKVANKDKALTRQVMQAVLKNCKNNRTRRDASGILKRVGG